MLDKDNCLFEEPDNSTPPQAPVTSVMVPAPSGGVFRPRNHMKRTSGRRTLRWTAAIAPAAVIASVWLGPLPVTGADTGVTCIDERTGQKKQANIVGTDGPDIPLTGTS